jgi:uncharacterized protein (DUF1800 family)
VVAAERLAVSRLINRIGFGPKPGEFAELLSLGFDRAAAQILSRPSNYRPNLADELSLSDLGLRPRPNTPEILKYAEAKRFQLRSASLWWLDEMVSTDSAFVERMTWFWHGHWATSYQKVDEPIVMFNQIDKLRKHATGNFKELSREMVLDGALIFWLDGQRNTARAPNENLSRELMELFILGVNRYTEADVKETAKALTGYNVKKSSGVVSRNLRQSFNGQISFLGTRGTFDALSLVDYLVSLEDCQRFIPERIWYRFISTSSTLTDENSISDAFYNRDISRAMQALVAHEGFQDPLNTQVKSPLEWLVATLRAFQILPSKFERPDYLLNLLQNLGQRPFFPPSVGGWPADEAWISAASAQVRIQAAQYLAKHANLDELSSKKQSERIDFIADWLGIPEWSDRTRMALQGAIRDVQRLALLAICSPEFTVNA